MRTVTTNKTIVTKKTYNIPEVTECERSICSMVGVSARCAGIACQDCPLDVENFKDFINSLGTKTE